MAKKLAVEAPFSALHPAVGGWCDAKLGSPTPPQIDALPLGLERRTHLICSPTGTGKTLAAFLPVMSRLADLRDRDELFPRPYVLYISPLRALGYDVEHNVRRPLKEMGLLERPNTERAVLRRGRIRETFVRTGVRTSDTPIEERRLMMTRPPHILMTTPESLALMLAMESYRKHLKAVDTVIIDEVHALAGNKRGSYLALCLESLEELVPEGLVRVGLSATVAPLERVARFVSGATRDCAIVDKRGLRAIRLEVSAPFSGAMAPMTKIAERCVELGSDVRTQLVFTNVRSQAERVAHEMALVVDPTLADETHSDIAHAHAVQNGVHGGVAVAAPDAIARPRTDAKIGIHHSALERSVRHRTEAQLRAGELHTVVCSSSLELGVDIGFVDRVCIVGGARGMTPTLQRVGRAGHRPGAVADGVIVAQDRDDIIEAAATKRCIREGILEELTIPEAPLDVLAQWLVMSVCYDKRFPIADALALARRAEPYRDLTERDVRACVAYLAGGGAGEDAAHVRRLGADDVAIYGLGRDVCSAFFENVGTIPDESQVQVGTRGGGAIGKLEESFVASLREGDVMLINGRTFKVKEMRSGGVTVEPFAGRPNVPTWSSHIKGIPVVLAAEIAALRSGIAERLSASKGGARETLAWLKTRYGLEGAEASHAVRYIAQQMAISAVPAPGGALVEIYRMDRRQTAVFHTCAGRRANEALARVVGARLFRELRVNTQITTDDNGFLVTMPLAKSLPDAVWATLLHARDYDRDLLDGLRAGYLLRQHFRYVANTGLLVLRRAGGKTLRRSGLRWNAQKIFDRLLEAEPDFPLLRETVRFVTTDLLDGPGALAFISALPSELRVIHPAAASPFTFGIVTSSFGDSVVMDDRTSMVEALHERVLSVMGERDEAPTPIQTKDGPLFDPGFTSGVPATSRASIERVAKIKDRRLPRRLRDS